MRTRLVHTLVGTIGVAILLPACTTDTNARNTIGAERTLPALTFAQPGESDEREAPVDTPTTRLDRAGWQTIEYRLPVDGTAHAPIWRTRASLDDSPPRQHGIYPTAETVLDLGAGAEDHLMLGITQPIIAMGDLFLLPVRMIAEPVWTTRQSPSLYKRWRAGEWLVGPMPEADGAR